MGREQIAPASDGIPGMALSQGVFAWQDVAVFFSMCSEALSAKTAATEMMHAEVQKAHESLQHHEAQAAQARDFSASLTENTRFLERQLEAVIKDRQAAKEKTACLQRERDYMLEERDILRQQLDSHEAGSEDQSQEAWLVHMLQGRLEEEHKKRAQAETELDREHAEIETLRQVIMDLESKHMARRAEWQEREASLVRCLEVADLASSCIGQAKSTTSAFCAGLLSGVKSGIKPSGSMLRSASSPLQEEAPGAMRQSMEFIGSHWLAHEAADNITDDDSCRIGVKRWRRAITLHPAGSHSERQRISTPDS